MYFFPNMQLTSCFCSAQFGKPGKPAAGVPSAPGLCARSTNRARLWGMGTSRWQFVLWRCVQLCFSLFGQVICCQRCVHVWQNVANPSIHETNNYYSIIDISFSITLGWPMCRNIESIFVNKVGKKKMKWMICVNWKQDLFFLFSHKMNWSKKVVQRKTQSAWNNLENECGAFLSHVVH